MSEDSNDGAYAGVKDPFELETSEEREQVDDVSLPRDKGRGRLLYPRRRPGPAGGLVAVGFKSMLRSRLRNPGTFLDELVSEGIMVGYAAVGSYARRYMRRKVS